MAITYQALLVSGARAWLGSGQLTYSILTTVPSYYPKVGSSYDIAPEEDPRTLVPTNASVALSSEQRPLVALAVAAWNEVAAINMVAAATGQTGDITFGAWADGSDGYGYVVDFAGTRGTLSTKGDVWFNNSNNAQLHPNFGDDGWQTYIHELGHALGLHHPNEDPDNDDRQSNSNNQWTVMSYDLHPSQTNVQNDADIAWPITPMPLDIQAIQSLYGVNTTTRTGDTTYGGPAVSGTTRAYDLSDGGLMSNGRGAILTIWDSGGTDTLSGANQTKAVSIDLQPGHFSTIGNIANNVGIAFSATANGSIINWIENAIGGRGNDTLVGNAVANRLEGGMGNDTLNGLAGKDIAAFSGLIDQHTINKNGSSFTVADTVAGRDGTDTLIDVERLQFVDKSLAFDIEGTAGEAYRLYQAAFDRVPDQAGLGYWISELDQQKSNLGGVALSFLRSEEFRTTYRDPDTLSNEQFLTLLYANVLDRVPDQNGLNYWLNDLQNGYLREGVLASFSESVENKANVIGLIQNGIAYLEWHG